MKLKLGLMVLVVALLAVGACQKKSDSSPVAAPIVIATSQLVDDYNGPCTQSTGMGTAFDGTSFYTALSIYSNESYLMITRFYTGTTCYLSGGLDLLTYMQTGAITSIGAATAPSGATKFAITQASNFLTIAVGASAAAWKALLDGACTASNFTIGTNLNMQGKTCTHATLTTQTFGWSNDVLYNVGTLTGTTFSVSQPNPVFKLGNATYPTSVGYDFTPQ